MLTPELLKKIVPIVGRGEEGWIALGASKDPQLMNFSREMRTIELQHPKIFGLRASNTTMNEVKGMFKNIGQTPEGVRSALDTMYNNAQDSIDARTTGKNNGKGDFIIEEDK